MAFLRSSLARIFAESICGVPTFAVWCSTALTSATLT